MLYYFHILSKVITEVESPFGNVNIELKSLIDEYYEPNKVLYPSTQHNYLSFMIFAEQFQCLTSTDTPNYEFIHDIYTNHFKIKG
jgi:hypothetical protein